MLMSGSEGITKLEFLPVFLSYVGNVPPEHQTADPVASPVPGVLFPKFGLQTLHLRCCGRV